MRKGEVYQRGGWILAMELPDEMNVVSMLKYQKNPL